MIRYSNGRRRTRVEKLQRLAMVSFIAFALAGPIRAQSGDAPQRFDAAVIKRGASNADKGLRVGPGGQFTAAGLTLRELIAAANGIPATTMHARIVGGPSWIDSATFDVIAKASVNVSPPSQLSMLQSLLAERFGLQLRRDKQDAEAYALMVMRPDRLGPSLAKSASDCGASRPARATPGNLAPPCVVRVQPGRIEGDGITMDMLVRNGLSRYINDRIVIDRTNLVGLFDVRLEWTSLALQDSTSNQAADGVSLFTAVQEQLGLKLQPAQAPVDIFIVERVEMPQLD